MGRAMDEGIWEYGGMTSLLEQRGMSFTLEIWVCSSANVKKKRKNSRAK